MELSKEKQNARNANSRNSQRLIQKRANSESDDQHSASEEPATKKARRNSIASSSLLQPIIQKEKSFVDLPPEMYDTILSYVATTDLLNCRKVNPQWNAISSRIMRGRDDIHLCFEFSAIGKFIQILPHRHRELIEDDSRMSKLKGKTLTDLVVCLQQSQHFPVTSFRFDGVNNLDSRDLRNFLTIWGKSVRSLNVCLTDSEKNCQILQKLLYEKTPQLKKIEIAFLSSDYFFKSPSSIRFLTGSNQLQLNDLQVLSVDSSYRGYSKIIEDILTASTNLKAICMKHEITGEDLNLLQKTKKLHCLKSIELLVTEEIIAYWKKSPQCMDLQLESLSVSLDESSYGQHSFKLSATEMMNRLFHSSKDVIQSLYTEPLGQLTGLVFPKFEKLQALRVQNYSAEDAMFPLLFDWPDKFPNIKDLGIECGTIDLLFNQSVKTLPRVETLRISCAERNTNREIMNMTPNVKCLFILDVEAPWIGYDFAINFKDIVTHLPKLEYLRWDISNCHSKYELDAVITGLPKNLCKKLSTKFRDMDELSADKVSRYGANRRHSSILDLKELKNFDIAIYGNFFSSEDSDSDAENDCSSKDKAGFGPESIFYKTKFSKVSKFLGFDLVPNVKVGTYRMSFD